MIKTSIASPCHQDWNSMKIGINQRHCTACKKDVIDFTQKTKEEIIAYLITHAQESTCARAYSHQLDFTRTEVAITIHALQKKPLPSNVAFFVLSASTFLMLSCQSPSSSSFWSKGNSEQIVDDKEKATNSQCEKDTEKHDDIAFAGMIVPLDMLENKEENLYSYTSVMPEFVGGMDSLQAFLSKNIVYPSYEKKNKIEGTVYATFVVDTLGNVKNIEITQSVENALNFDKEVKRVLGKMPTWQPGKLASGEIVNVVFYLPVEFKL